MICYDRLWKTLIDKHLKKTELRDKIGISNATLAKLGKNEPVNLKVIDAICQELDCDVEDVLEIKQDKPSIGQIHLVTAIQAEPD